MKTRTNSTKTRFGRILSGVMALAMSTSLFAAVPASAETTATSNPYELIYDISANYTGTDHFKKDGDVIYNPANDQNNGNLETVIPNDAVEKIKGKKVRFHYEYMTEADTNPVFMVKTFGVYDSEKNTINGADVSIGFQGRLQSDKSIKVGHAGKIWDYSAPKTYITNADDSDFKFNKGQWYSMDTVFDYKTYDITYYIDGRKVGTSSFSNYSNLWNSIRKIQICLFKTKDNDGTELDFVAARQNWRNMKIDTGFGVDVTNTNDKGATLNFTEPVTDLSSVKVKCLEKGTTQTATATKVNDMQYTIAYNAENSVGGDYALIFDEAFAAAHGMTNNTVVYAQTPSGYASNEVLYDAYDNFESAEKKVSASNNATYTKTLEGEDKVIVAPKEIWGGRNTYYEMIFTDELANKIKGKKVRFEYEYKHGEDIDNKYAPGYVMMGHFRKNTTGSIDYLMQHAGISFVRVNDGNATASIMYSNGLGNPYSLTNTAKDGSGKNVVFPKGNYVKVTTDYDFGKHNVVYTVGDKKYETVLPDTTQDNVNEYGQMDTLYSIRIYLDTCKWQDSNMSEYWNAQPKYFKNMKLIDLSECNYGIKSVSYSADGTNFAPAIDKVDCETKYVKVEFTNPMDETTLAGINVKTNTGDAVSDENGRSLSTDGKTYTIELTNTLAANSQYDVIVPDTVKTESGVKFNKAYEGTITTTAGTLAVKALKIKKGDREITAENKNIIVANDKVKAYAEIKNTTTRTEPAYVCVCVYNNGVLTGVNFDMVELKKEDTTNGIATKEVEVDVRNTENLTIKAFVWENFSLMVPLSASYGI